MKRYLIILLACAMGGMVMAQDLQTNDQTFFDPDANKEEAYQFHTEYRVEGGYVQHWQHSQDETSRLYLHGGRVGMTFDFMLPYHLSLQTGMMYTLAYGRSSQKFGIVDEEESYAASDSIIHRVTEHWLTVPVRLYYNIKLWKQLNMFFFGGPQFMIGLAEIDNIDNQLPPKATSFYQDELGMPLSRYNRFKEELVPFNMQLGIGGGFEWDCYRLQAGYDFGLNNQRRHGKDKGLHMWEWSWFVSFAYRLPIK
ncbi:MAG: PorT family protein [Paludibacteraceae bacterium]|nr:PorT family protein [Paludibacteraceae bacterium]